MPKNFLFRSILIAFLLFSLFLFFLQKIPFIFTYYLKANLPSFFKKTQEKAKEGFFEINLKSEKEKDEIIKKLVSFGQEKSEKLSYQNISQEKENSLDLEKIQKQLNEANSIIEDFKEKIEEIKKSKLKEKEDNNKEKFYEIEQETEEEMQGQKEWNEKEQEKDEDDESLVKLQNAFCPVNINTAPVEALKALNGVDFVLAERIISSRPFYSLNDLLKVNGIGEKTFQKIIDQNCAYVDSYYMKGSGYSLSVPEETDENTNLNEEQNNSSQNYHLILISEVQIEGESKFHDFIELYNPNDFDVDISNYKLRKRTSSGKEYSINVLPSGSIIMAKGYYLWASSEDENYPSLINADTYTKENISENNSIALFAPDNKVISSLSWGENQDPFLEGSSFVYNNWDRNQSLGRILDSEVNEYKNSGDNSLDFEIQQPTPKQKNQPLKKEELPIQSQNLLSNEFFEEWKEPASNAQDLEFWAYNGNKDHIKRVDDALKGNFSLQWSPITSAQDLIQNGIKITKKGDYYIEVWIKPLNVNEENYIRVAVDVANSAEQSFKRAVFTDYKSESGWMKIEKSYYLQPSENSAFRIRALRVGSEGPYFLIGAVWLGFTTPPPNWL